MKPVPVEYLRTRLICDASVGSLIWRPADNESDGWNARHAGREAGTVTKRGYRMLRFWRGKATMTLLAHRVVWAMHYGVEMFSTLDHINGDPSDNRISNLREADRFENMRNMKRPSDNTSGAVGVYRARRKWRARIRENGRMHNLGTFDTFEEAVEVRKAAERRLGYHPNHGRDA